MAMQADRSAYSFYKATRPSTLAINRESPPSGPVTLSEVLLQDLRVERAHAQILHVGQGATFSIATLLQPLLYTVLEGAITLRVLDEAPVVLKQGDSAVIFYGDSHRVGDGPMAFSCNPPHASPQLAETVEHRSVGQGPPQAVLLQSLVELTYLRKNAHVSRAAPDVMVLRSQTGPYRDASLKSFPFSAEQLVADLEGPGALALVSAFANIQLCYALKQFTSRLWGESIHDIR
jgi:hypothetical protein